ncbi:unnamed protein product [Rhizophagus irregularis]|nr:unnamed protein product [Rhizophagus irregularis]
MDFILRKSLSSKTEELKLWSDRVVARLEYENINGADFIRQLDSYYTVMSSEKSPKLYGISWDPETNDYILVMQYAEIDWYQKISILLEIAKGLKDIHDHGYVRRDFHGGNVLLDLSESFEGEENERLKI